MGSFFFVEKAYVGEFLMSGKKFCELTLGKVNDRSYNQSLDVSVQLFTLLWLHLDLRQYASSSCGVP